MPTQKLLHTILLVLSLNLALAFSANAAPIIQKPVVKQQNFNEVLHKIQDSRWHGTFKVNALIGLINCSGPFDITFLNLDYNESFARNLPTVSYRHFADFSHSESLLCPSFIAGLSPIHVGQCTKDFPMKYNPAEGRQVPVRTIIAKNNGAQAVVSGPKCEDDKLEVSRQESELTRAVLSQDGKHLELTIRLIIKDLIPVDLNYVLNRL